MADLRFCAYQYQHMPLDALRGRWRDAERSGFDVLWNCDTVVEPDRPRHTLFDGPATLTMMAADTRRIRVGTLVTSVPTRMRRVSAAIMVSVAGPSKNVCRGRSGSTTVSQFHRTSNPAPSASRQRPRRASNGRCWYW